VTGRPISDADLWAWMDRDAPGDTYRADIRRLVRGAVLLCSLWTVAVVAAATIAYLVL
jgi:hypothetical protein